jgi:hypothetical protein
LKVEKERGRKMGGGERKEKVDDEKAFESKERERERRCD